MLVRPGVLRLPVRSSWREEGEWLLTLPSVSYQQVWRVAGDSGELERTLDEEVGGQVAR